MKWQNTKEHVNKQLIKSGSKDNDVVIWQTIRKGANDYSGSRGSKYYGISKNGRVNWQVLSMFNAKKVYISTVDVIELAAIIYDIFQMHYKGLRAKTNFNYTRHEVE